MVDFRRILSEKYKNFEYDRYYPVQGEIWTLNDNQTKVLILAGGFETVSVIVIRTGFYFKKGITVELGIGYFPYVHYKDGYTTLEAKIVKPNKIRYEKGDIIQIPQDDLVGAVVNIDGKYLTLYILDDARHNGAYKDTMVVALDPYYEYRTSN